jgi:hypothetical protein
MDMLACCLPVELTPFSSEILLNWRPHSVMLQFSSAFCVFAGLCTCPAEFPNTVRLFGGLWEVVGHSPWTSRAAGTPGSSVGVGLAP